MGCRPVRLDVTDESGLRAATDWDIDVLANAAGVAQGGPLEELPLDLLRRQFEVNVFGALRVAQLVAPGMRRRRHGRIVNVSSVAGRITIPGMGAPPSLEPRRRTEPNAVPVRTDRLRQPDVPLRLAGGLMRTAASRV